MRQILRSLSPNARRLLEQDLAFPPAEENSIGDRLERVVPIVVCRDVGEAPPIKVQLADVLGTGFTR